MIKTLKQLSYAVFVFSILLFTQCSTSKKEAPQEQEEIKDIPGIGIQLYTVRDSMRTNPKATLEKVAQLGYKYLELASFDTLGQFYGMAPADFKKMANDLGLEPVSAHIGISFMAANPEQVINSCKEAGLSYVVLPWLSPDQRSIDAFKSHIEVINNIAPMCTAAGMTFAYHNHDFEFIPVDNQVPMDLILSGTDPAHVKLELDLYWVSKVGLDPVELIQKNKDRVALWHVKDMDGSPEKKFTEVGNGVINYSEIFKLRESSALEYFFVEQDRSDDPLKSIEISIGNVTKILAN